MIWHLMGIYSAIALGLLSALVLFCSLKAELRRVEKSVAEQLRPAAPVSKAEAELRAKLERLSLGHHDLKRS